MAMGAIMQQAGNLTGTMISGGLSERAAKKARKFQKKVLKNRYQWQVADLRKAGINPMMAPSLGAPGAPAGVQAQVPDFGKAFARGAELGPKVEKDKSQAALNAAATMNQSSAASLNSVKAEKVDQDMREQRFDNPITFAKDLITDEIPSETSGIAKYIREKYNDLKSLGGMGYVPPKDKTRGTDAQQRRRYNTDSYPDPKLYVPRR